MTPGDPGITALDLVLVAAILVLAALAVVPRARSVTAMAFLGIGVVMALVWLRLGSVDVALAEAALGTGLLSALLVWLAVRLPAAADAGPVPDERRGPARWVVPGLGVLAGAVVATVVAGLVLRVEQRLPRWEPMLDGALAASGVDHDITAVLLEFRAYDTLLETAVLMVAGLVALAVGRDGGLHGATVPLPPVPPPYRWLVRLTAPVLLVLGLWLLFAGSTGSGGAFQSGAVLAGLLILLHTAHVPLARATLRWMRPALVVGVIAFILAGALGPATGGAWLEWGPGWAFAAMLTVEILLTVGITAGLYVLYLALEDPADASRPARPVTQPVTRAGER